MAASTDAAPRHPKPFASTDAAPTDAAPEAMSPSLAEVPHAGMGSKYGGVTDGGLGAYEVDVVEKAMEEFLQRTSDGAEASVVDVTAILDKINGPCERLVRVAESLDFVDGCLGKLTTCLDRRYTKPGVRTEEPEAIRLARAKLLCHEGTVAYVKTRTRCESRGLEEWDEDFRTEVHGGLRRCLSKHRSSAATLRELRKKGPLAQQLKTLGEAAQMLPQFRKEAVRPLEEACVLFKALDRAKELEDCRDQLKHLKDLQKLATEKQFACDKDIRTHVDLLPDEYKPEVKDARPNLLAETTFHAAVLGGSQALRDARHFLRVVEAAEIEAYAAPDKPRRWVVSGLVDPPLPLPIEPRQRDVHAVVFFQNDGGDFSVVTHGYKATTAQLVSQDLDAPQASRRSNAYHELKFGVRMDEAKRRQLEYVSFVFDEQIAKASRAVPGTAAAAGGAAVAAALGDALAGDLCAGDATLKCAQCGEVSSVRVTVSRCARCKTASYCSRHCQKKHWLKHKPTCVPVPAAAS